jgi:hypothetical protein
MLVRILIRGSIPLTNGSGCVSGSFFSRQWPLGCQQKNIFCYYFVKIHRNHFSKIKSPREDLDPDQQHCFLKWKLESNLFIISGCRTSVTATRRTAHPAPIPSGRCPSTSSIEGTIRILTRTSPAATSSPLAQTFTTSKTRHLPAAYHIWTCKLA